MMRRAGDSVHIAWMWSVERAHCSKCKCQSCHTGQHLHPVVLTLCATATLRISSIGTIPGRKLSTRRRLIHKNMRGPLTQRRKSLSGTASSDQYPGSCESVWLLKMRRPRKQETKMPLAEVCSDVLKRKQAIRTEKIYGVTNSRSQRKSQRWRQVPPVKGAIHG